jgi:glutaminase
VHIPLPFHETTTAAAVSTGELPTLEVVAELLIEAFEEHRSVDEGAVADYIPALANADPNLYGASIVGVAGRSFSLGDAGHLFSLQSISKAFVFALVCDAIGHDEARLKLGVNATGLAFNSVMAIELNEERTMNPMVNAGAMATTSLAPGATKEDRWEFIVQGLSQFAGRSLDLDPAVYASESSTNLRNQGIAHLLESYGRLYANPDETTDVYTRQCSLLVSAHDLAVMGATLANGGVNPVTGQKVVEPFTCKHVLAAMATAGLYEHSGDWLYEVGLPGKSGVSGGIVTISPGKGGFGTFSPPLDEAGNSVRGQRLTRHLSEKLGLNVFASKPAATSHPLGAA